MELKAGTKLGPYEIVSLVGAGGMGEVYRARDTRLQRDVAVKILPLVHVRDGAQTAGPSGGQSGADGADRLRRFEQEAKAVAALNHPNLLIVFDVGTAPLGNGAAESPFIVSELLEGATLREKLAAGALRERRAVDYAIQIAHGLATAHERGIVHRDIKPDNIFVTNDGRMKILDFGLAKLTQAEAANPESMPTVTGGTQAGIVLGTMGYMSPEQLRGKPADARSDIFSFGAVLYEMLAGRRAFRGETGADVISAILNHEPPELTATNREISVVLDHIVHHCMEKDPQQRFQSARDIAFQLSELTGISSSTGIKAVEAVETRKQSRTGLLAGVGAVAAIALCCAAWFIGRGTARHDPPTFDQVTFQQGYVTSARFLPDGKSIVTASKWGSNPTLMLYTAGVDSQALRPMGIKAEDVQSVSAQGELLIVQDHKSIGPGYVDVGTLARLSVNGGSPRPLMDSVQYADWAPGGNDFAVVRFFPQRHVYRLEYPVGTVLYETTGWVSHPRFSRDGKKIAFLDHPVFGDDMGYAAVVDLKGNYKRLSGTFGTTQGLAWSPSGDEVWFSGSHNGASKYWGMYGATLSGRERMVYSGPGNIAIQDALPDGRVLVQVVDARREIMVSTPDHPELRDFTWMDWVYGARFSADGKWILFGDQHSGPNYGTFLRNLDGSPAIRLGDGDPADLSPDGKWALSRSGGKPDQMLLLPTGTGEQRKLPQGKIVDHMSARWLPDGRIVVNGTEANKPDRAYIVDESKGTETAVTPEGVLARAVTADGKRVLASAAGSTQYQIFPIEGGAAQPFTVTKEGDYAIDFTPDGQALLVWDVTADGGAEIYRVELSSGKRTSLHKVNVPGTASMSNGLQVTATRDGKSYAFQYHPVNSTEYVVNGLK
jgi:Tol biopolymer transport system component